MRLGILGGGRAAWAYGSAWRRISWPIDGVWLRAESQSRLPELLEDKLMPCLQQAATRIGVRVSYEQMVEVN